VLPLPPRRSESTRRSGFVNPCCLRPNEEGSASGVFLCRGHLWVHLRCGPVTRSPSYRWLCQSASDHLVSLLPATQATGLLTLALAGLTPAGCASLSWTHFVLKIRPPPSIRRLTTSTAAATPLLSMRSDGEGRRHAAVRQLSRSITVEPQWGAPVVNLESRCERDPSCST